MVFSDQPISRICGLGDIIMRSRLRVTASRKGEKTPLHFEPGVGPHFFGGQFVFGLPIEPVGTFEIARLAAKIRQAGKAAPRPLGLDRVNVSGLGLPVTSVLKIEIGAHQAGFDAVIRRRDRKKSRLDIG